MMDGWTFEDGIRVNKDSWPEDVTNHLEIGMDLFEQELVASCVIQQDTLDLSHFVLYVLVYILVSELVSVCISICISNVNDNPHIPI